MGNNYQFYIGATLIWMAHEYRRNKKYKLAEDNYKSALKIFPENPDLLFNYGNLLWEIERYEEAYDNYKMSLLLYPKSITFQKRLKTIEEVIKETPNHGLHADAHKAARR